MINAKLQNLYNIKNDIGTAIVNKGGTITESTPFYSYAGQIDNISTGTPQTVFQDSTGAKWARTNVVNLTNVSNNVTSDFNWWQSANGATSDPILTGGTVGANISGNIRIVSINQVYGNEITNIVATDTTGAKYVAYNGYDFITNPNPPSTITGTNVVGTNEASMPFVNNTPSYGGTIYSVTTNNGFIYAGGATNLTVQKFGEDNLVRVGNTANYGGIILSVTTNNGFIYVGGNPLTGTNRGVSKFYESNLVTVGNTVNYGLGTGSWQIQSITINNGFIYVGGADTSSDNVASSAVKKFHESNLVFVGSTPAYGGAIQSVTTNNGFIYVGGQMQRVQKFYEDNLAFVGNTPSYGGAIRSVTTNNGFIYVGGDTIHTVQKFNESTLAFVGNTVTYGGQINQLVTNNGFIYAGGQTNQTVQKFHESNLVFVGNTASYGGVILSVTTNNGFIYAGGSTNLTVQKFQESQTVLEQIPVYTFNRWLLNNGATGTVLFANTTIVNGGTYNGPNVIDNPSNIALTGTSSSYLGAIYGVVINDGNMFVGGHNGTFGNGIHGNTSFIRKYNLSSLTITANSGNHNSIVQSMTLNNGFLYSGTSSSGVSLIRKWHESNLVQSASVNYGGGVTYSMVTNGGFLFAAIGQGLQKFHESNLVRTINQSINPLFFRIVQNNGFIYGAGFNPPGIFKYHQSNLAFVGNTANLPSTVESLAVANGFLYTYSNQNIISKFNEQTLAFVENSPIIPVNGYIYDLVHNNGFIYVGLRANNTSNGITYKYYADNLQFVGNTLEHTGRVNNTAVFEGNIYTSLIYANATNSVVLRHKDGSTDQEALTFYTATKIKEDI
jgi:hypothetical protein